MSLVFKALEYLGLIAGGLTFSLFWMFFWMEWLPEMVSAARTAGRAVRAAFLAVGWVVIIARLVLA